MKLTILVLVNRDSGVLSPLSHAGNIYRSIPGPSLANCPVTGHGILNQHAPNFSANVEALLDDGGYPMQLCMWRTRGGKTGLKETI